MKEKKCKYLLPCGWCDRLNDKCIFEQKCENTSTLIHDNIAESAICIHDWQFTNNINTSGCVYKCSKCGAIRTEAIGYISTTSDTTDTILRVSGR